MSISSTENEPLPEDDPRFVSVQEEVRLFQSLVREVIEEEDTARYRRASELFAEILDCAAVDAILELTPGTTRTWADEDEFMQRAVEWSVHVQRYGHVAEDFGRALEPRQREAARLLAVEKLTRTETAERVGVDRRTIFNWTRMPTFTHYLTQLESQESKRVDAEWRGRRAEMEQDLQDLRTIAIKKAKGLAEDGDSKLIVHILAKLL